VVYIAAVVLLRRRPTR